MQRKTETKNQIRVPIVAILGHVDHGKTTILDAIRKTNVQSCEVGGITQRISVFTITPDIVNKGRITFIDTPGHEAFDLMRFRGGKVADIVLLIVAADDGVMPQTKESIEIIKTQNVKPIIVINKVDLPNVDVAKVKRQVANEGLIPEEMGGKVPVVEVSGKTGKGIKELLETINVMVEVEGLQNREKLLDGVEASGMVLESVKDKFKGFVSSLVVISGSVAKGDYLVYKCGTNIKSERIKGFVSEENCNIESLGAGYGAKIIGLSSLLDLGSEVIAVSEANKGKAEKLFKEQIKEIEKVEEKDEQKADFFASYFAQEDSKDKRKLNIILKSSSEGSLEAISKSLDRIKSENVDVTIITREVGDVNKGDIELAEVTKAIVLCFEVNIDSTLSQMADKKKILIRNYDIIYKLVDEVRDTVEMLEGSEEAEEELGYAEVKGIFILSDGKKVIGCRVKEGLIKRGERCYIVRNDDIVAQGKIVSMKHQKTEINEARVNDDMGVIVEPVPDVAEGDKLHCFKVLK